MSNQPEEEVSGFAVFLVLMAMLWLFGMVVAVVMEGFGAAILVAPAMAIVSFLVSAVVAFMLTF